jgi:ABC-type nitrate/sulfonate/bicarbonate transport system permease component
MDRVRVTLGLGLARVGLGFFLGLVLGLGLALGLGLCYGRVRGMVKF